MFSYTYDKGTQVDKTTVRSLTETERSASHHDELLRYLPTDHSLQ